MADASWNASLSQFNTVIDTYWYVYRHLARSIARSGVDWVLVDTEHGNLDDAAMHEAVQAIAGCSVSPVVRIPACEGWMFKRELYIL